MLTKRLALAFACALIAGPAGAQSVDPGAPQSPPAAVTPSNAAPAESPRPAATPPAEAQGVQVAPSAPVPAAAAATAATAPAQSGSTASLAEVVVTATKRSVRAQDVPAAVTVVDGAQLVNMNITDTGGLSKAAPSVTTITAPGGADMQIRGIGSVSFSRTSEQSVGIVVDGVALANASLGAPPLFDTAQVEVLEGPQGTLYGRNSSAGIVNITTVAPDPRGFGAALHSDVGTRDSAIVYGNINVPVTEYSALRVSGSFTQTPHTVYNEFQHSWDKTDTTSFRARYRWEPTEKLTFNLIADYSRLNLNGGSNWAVFQSTPGSALTNDLAQCGVTPTQKNSTGCTDGPNYLVSKAYGFSGQADYDLGFATISSITAYRKFLSAGDGDSDSVQENLLNTNFSGNNIRNLSEELRLNSQNKGFFQYVFGLYYFNSRLFDTGTQEGEIIQLLPPPFGLPIQLGQSFATGGSSRSYAAYEESTLHFLPSLRGIIGLRYGHENVSANTVRAVAPGAVAAFASTAPVSGAGTDNYVAYRFGLQYDIAPKVMSYLTFSRGYKGPAINDQAASASVPLIVKPEIPLAWEAGLKSRFLHNRVQANVAIFDVRYQNYQSQFYDPALTAFVYGNAPKVVTKGVELSVLGRIASNWAVNFGAMWDEATYGKGYLVQCSQGQTAAQGCESQLGGNSATDAGGNRLVGAPLWKLNAQSEFHFDLTGWMEAFLDGDVTYTSRINYDQAYDPTNSAGPHVLLGMRTGVRSPESKWGLSFYVRNLLDQRIPTYRLSNPIGNFEGDNNSDVQILGPDSFRVFGVSLDAKF